MLHISYIPSRILWFNNNDNHNFLDALHPITYYPTSQLFMELRHKSLIVPMLGLYVLFLHSPMPCRCPITHATGCLYFGQNVWDVTKIENHTNMSHQTTHVPIIFKGGFMKLAQFREI